MPLQVFISHAHEDKLIADAIKTLISDVFPPSNAQPIKVEYSSDDGAGQGPEIGTQWVDWILEAVRGANICIVIFTEASVSAPWLTWEAGAFTAVMSTAQPSKEAVKSVVPLLVGVTVDRIPAPLQSLRAVLGERPTEIVKLLFRLHERGGSSEPLNEALVNERAAGFVQGVQRALKTRLREQPARLQLPELAPIHFINARYGLPLEPWEGRISNGIRLYCGKFTGSARQRWLLRRVRKGVYWIATANNPSNRSSNKPLCISIEGDADKPGAAILLWEYEREESQHWRFELYPGHANSLSTVRIVNCATDLCLMPRVSDQQLVQVKSDDYLDEDWCVLSAPTLNLG